MSGKIFVSEAPDPPRGVWRQITHALPTRADCHGWYTTIKEAGLSHPMIKEVAAKGVTMYEVWAKRK